MRCNDGWRRVCVSARGDKSQIMSAREGERRRRRWSGWAGAETEEKGIGPDPTNDKSNQSVWEGSGRRRALFPPSALWSQGSARGQERDL